MIKPIYIQLENNAPLALAKLLAKEIGFHFEFINGNRFLADPKLKHISTSTSHFDHKTYAIPSQFMEALEHLSASRFVEGSWYVNSMDQVFMCGGPDSNPSSNGIIAYVSLIDGFKGADILDPSQLDDFVELTYEHPEYGNIIKNHLTKCLSTLDMEVGRPMPAYADGSWIDNNMIKAISFNSCSEGDRRWNEIYLVGDDGDTVLIYDGYNTDFPFKELHSPLQFESFHDVNVCDDSGDMNGLSICDKKSSGGVHIAFNSVKSLITVVKDNRLSNITLTNNSCSVVVDLTMLQTLHSFSNVFSKYIDRYNN